MTPTALLRWFFEQTTTVNTARGLNPQPRESAAPVRTNFTPGVLDRIMDIGGCLDDLGEHWPQHLRTIIRAFTEPPWERERLFFNRGFRNTYCAGMGILTSIMEEKGVLPCSSTAAEEEPMEREEQFLIVKEAASLMRVHPETLRDKCRRGDIAGARRTGETSGQWRIPVSYVEANMPPDCKRL